mgnify:CR=1 FL=1
MVAEPAEGQPMEQTISVPGHSYDVELEDPGS